MTKLLLMPLFFLNLLACSSSGVLKTNEGQFKEVKDEFEKVVSVKSIQEKTEPVKVEKLDYNKKTEVEKPKPEVEPPSDIKKKSKEASKKADVKTDKLRPHKPSLEDGEGFDGRRPIVDPFLVGEKVTLSVKYFNITAGDIELMVLPYKTVNGKKSYHFKISLETNPTFSYFYTAKNTAETFVDFEELIPHTLIIENKESSRVVDARYFFDHKNLKAKEWEKKVSKKKGEEKKEIEWDIKPYTQNIISALFYLRVFTYEVGKKFAFRVSDDGKNYVFTGEALREETLDTPIGPIETIVIKPTFTLNNSFKPSGENYVWITKDKYRRIVQVESKIKIGTLVAKLKSIEAPKE